MEGAKLVAAHGPARLSRQPDHPHQPCQHQVQRAQGKKCLGRRQPLPTSAPSIAPTVCRTIRQQQPVKPASPAAPTRHARVDDAPSGLRASGGHLVNQGRFRRTSCNMTISANPIKAPNRDQPSARCRARYS